MRTPGEPTSHPHRRKGRGAEPLAGVEVTAVSDLPFTYDPHPSPTADGQRAGLLENPAFGRVFTDHMASIRYDESQGWSDARVGPRRPVMLDPAASVLHYAQEIFEGLKAYRTDAGDAVLFRPDANARRFQQSAQRLAMPVLPEALFLESITRLVDIDRAWIPEGDGSLYLRPFMIATEACLSVRPSSEYLFMVIAAPVASYFGAGAAALSVWVSQDHSRAAAGGTGAAKCGGNYAGSLAPQVVATRHECDQVVFLDAAERRWVEELGGMNIFFVFDDGSLLTPPLGGAILPGVTRDSLLTLARSRGLSVREEPYAIDQWRADAASGRLREVFACGTAAVVAAIGAVRSVDGGFTIGDGREGPSTRELRTQLVGIQRGRHPDPFGWMRTV